MIRRKRRRRMGRRIRRKRKRRRRIRRVKPGVDIGRWISKFHHHVHQKRGGRRSKIMVVCGGRVSVEEAVEEAVRSTCT